MIDLTASWFVAWGWNEVLDVFPQKIVFQVLLLNDVKEDEAQDFFTWDFYVFISIPGYLLQIQHSCSLRVFDLEAHMHGAIYIFRE